MIESDQPPKEHLDSIADDIFHMCANIESRQAKGENFPPEEITTWVERLKDYAAGLQLAASRMD